MISSAKGKNSSLPLINTQESDFNPDSESFSLRIRSNQFSQKPKKKTTKLSLNNPYHLPSITESIRGIVTECDQYLSSTKSLTKEIEANIGEDSRKKLNKLETKRKLERMKTEFLENVYGKDIHNLSKISKTSKFESVNATTHIPTKNSTFLETEFDTSPKNKRDPKKQFKSFHLKMFKS